MDPFLGEIRLFSGNYIPHGWAACDGQTLTISEYQALYSLLGTAFGGNGTTNFAVPDLRTRLAVGQSTTPPPGMTGTYPRGGAGGTVEVTLTEANLPSHTHPLNGTTTPATTGTPGPQVTFADLPDDFVGYVDGGSPTLANMAPDAVTSTGGNSPHLNVMPCMGITYIICIENGIYPQLN